MPGTQALADISRHTDSAHSCACLNMHDDVTTLPCLIGHVGVSPLLRPKNSVYCLLGKYPSLTPAATIQTLIVGGIYCEHKTTKGIVKTFSCN